MTRKSNPPAKAEAAIEAGCIVIRLAISNIPVAVEGGCAIGTIDPPLRVTDAKAFAKEVVRILNEEDEDGTTRVHRMFDEAFGEAVEQGAQGWEEIQSDDVECNRHES